MPVASSCLSDQRKKLVRGEEYAQINILYLKESPIEMGLFVWW
jgi:hypothetical protein